MTRALVGALGSPDLRKWQVTRLRLNGSRKLVARQASITYIYNELADGSWHVTKLRGGRVIAEREFGSIPLNVASYVAEAKRKAQAA